jgi:hypothetical protein
MPRNYVVKTALIGALWDAQKLLEEDKTREAINLLRRKIREIEKLDKSDWATVIW